MLLSERERERERERSFIQRRPMKKKKEKEEASGILFYLHATINHHSRECRFRSFLPHKGSGLRAVKQKAADVMGLRNISKGSQPLPPPSPPP